MSEHTKGPWKVDSSGYRVVSSNANVDGGKVASCSSYDNISSVGANARLIAAAPDLLEALEAAEKALTSLPHSWGFEFTDLPKIRAALKKAKP